MPDILYYGRGEPEPLDFGGRLPVALVFPGDAGLAYSSLGWQAAYRELRGAPNIAVERVFAHNSAKSVLTMESGRPLPDFAVAAFSLSHEEDAADLFSILRLSNLNPQSSKRPGLPILLAGGPLSFLNPAPLTEVLDAFFVGEAEAGFAQAMQVLRESLISGADKAAALAALSRLPGIYVPGISDKPAQRARHIDSSNTAKLACPAYSSFISSKAEFKDMLLIELNRGCPYGCRFCAAGYIYRPSRFAGLDEVKEIVEAANPPKVGLVGTALTDWPHLQELMAWLGARKTKYSLSSIRAAGVTEDLLSSLRLAGVRTLTLALEAPSRRLRLAANKNLEEDEFLRAVSLAAKYGVNHLKMYLIIGWPGESEEDYQELLDFLAQVQAAGAIGSSGKKSVGHATLTASCLVPKPGTPLQWAPMASLDYLEYRLAWLKKELKKIKGLRLGHDSPILARAQGLIARGGPELYDFLEFASQHGLKKAMAAFKDLQSRILDWERGQDEIFAWEAMLDNAVSRDYLWREWQRYKQAKATPACPPSGCKACGACPQTPTPLRKSR